MWSAHKVRIAVGVAAVACVSVVGLLPSTASADPQKGAPLNLICEGDLEVDAVVFSNGHWSPALDTESNAVYHPVAFWGEHFVVTDAAGDILFEEDGVDSAKKGNRLGVDLIECEYSYSFEDFDPYFDETIYIQGSGMVAGFVSG